MNFVVKSLPIVACAGALITNGCSREGAMVPAMQGPSQPKLTAALSRTKETPYWSGATNSSTWPAPKVLFVSDYTGNAVNIYRPDGSGPIGQISDGVSGPLGLAVDQSGTLYVANSSNNTVTEYPIGQASPSLTLSSGLTSVNDVGVSAAGLTYVVNFSNGTGSIVVYNPGNQLPSFTMNLSRPQSVAFDQNLNAYVSYTKHGSCPYCRAGVAEYKPASSQRETLVISPQTGQAGGIAVTRTGKIALGDQDNHTIRIYRPGQEKPVHIFRAPSHNPFELVIDKAEDRLFEADTASRDVVVFNFHTGAVQSTISTVGFPSGVAVYPADP